ncbi:MAG: NUDIX domain-containing protein [Anaerolineaceae bacterium]
MSIIEQGASPDRYNVIPRVLIFPFAEDGEVLLLKGAGTKKIWPGLWNGIGGHVEAGESILYAAKRELLEETGLTCQNWIFCGQVMVDTNSSPGIAFFIFKALEIAGNLVESAEGELSWLETSEALELPLVEDLHFLIRRVMDFRQDDRPFWGVYRYDPSGQLVMQFSD